MSHQQIKKAYQSSKNIYDDVLTQKHIWWKLYHLIFWNGVNDIEIAKKVLEVIPHDFSGQLLDVPVGTATFTIEKYAHLKQAQITCLDYSLDMLHQAKERFQARQLTNVTCIQGDVCHLPFDDEVFDVLLSMNGFHAFLDKYQAFDEVYRVLKKGGIFTGCFYIKGECRRTDFLVNHILAPRGWFSSPFLSYDDVKNILMTHYQHVSINHWHSMVYFHCQK